MKKVNRKTPFVFYLSLVLLAMTMFSTHLMSGLYARYTTVNGGGDEARVASFNVSETVKFNGAPIVLGTYNISKTFEVDDDGIFKAQTYTFEVKNSSEVAVRYTVTGTNVTNNLTPMTLTAKTVDIAPGETKSLEFVIAWNGELNDKYMGMVDYITITVTAEQID